VRLTSLFPFPRENRHERAIDGISFLSGDNGLQFLQHFQTREGTFALIAIIFWFFLIFPIMNGVMCSIKRNEYLRIEKADPKLVDL